MPPKRSKKVSNGKKSISTQTGDFNDNTSAQNQIKLLQRELADSKQQIILLQSEINVLKSKNNDRRSSDIKVDLLGINSLKIRNEKISSPRLGSKITKGCSCKGNCSNKICGCVKKSIVCQEFCRCNDARCQNQEPEKENVAQANLNEDGQNALTKFGRLTLNQEVLHASEKKAKRSSIFSPFDRDGISNATRISASPFSLETRRRLFSQESEDLIDIGSPDYGQENILAAEPKNLEDHEKKNLVIPRNKYSRNEPQSKDILENILTAEDEHEENSKNLMIPQIKFSLNQPQSNTSGSSSQNILETVLAEKQKHQEDYKENSRNLVVSQIKDCSNQPQSNISGSSSGSQDILDISLNPMMPKHQLPRSPINSLGTVIETINTKRFSPPKKELAVAEIDWEQHQSDLVICDKCKRKFFPHRIEKHITSCKGI